MRGRYFIVGLIVGLTLSLFIFCFVLGTNVEAATYYVRPDGGNRSQCTGLVDAPYPGSGSNQPCALEHPFWVHAPQGNHPTKLQGGDTMIIDGSSNTEYMIGFGAPNTTDTSKCHPSWPYDCYMRPIPSGPNAANPTRILGKGWDTGCSSPPQFWGTERVEKILNLNGSDNVEVQCLEITDHSSCQEHGPNPCNRTSPPFGEWAKMGLQARDSENVLLKNVNIHGIAFKGVHAGRLRDWTIEDSSIVANSFVGWDGDVGAFNSSNSGTMTFTRTKVQYNGCGETYPGLQPYNCYSQGQGGYGDGLGTHQTGANWVFNYVDFSHNVSDGLDLLYHDGSGTVTIKRSKFEGNAGNQVKIAANGLIENSIIIGNCNYFDSQSFTSTKSPGFGSCRAGGNTLVFAYHPGMTAEVYNSTLTGVGDTIVMSSQRTGCNGDEVIVGRNLIMVGDEQFGHPDTTDLYFAAGQGGNGSGPCGNVVFDYDDSIVYGTKSIANACENKLNTFCQDPKLAEQNFHWYNGPAMDVSLLSNSPARDTAAELVGKSSLDFNNFNRGASWDMGALEYGSTAQEEAICENSAQYCENQADCEAQGHYWYDNSCHESPPSCANGIEYCTTQAECVKQGYYWYNNLCHDHPPTCADGIQYCTTQTECETQGYYWYNSSCHASAPTCADGIQYCTTQLSCTAQGYYWYNGSCHSSPPTCSHGIQYCNTQSECESRGYYWYNDDCHTTAPTCTDGIQYCTTQGDCEAQGYYWYNNTCNATAPTCADGVEYCTTQSECTGQGYYWYNNSCHSSAPTCADGIQYCTTQSDCLSQSYYWYNSACHASPATCSDGVEYCTTQGDCESQGYYWYNNTCNAQPEPEPTCADGIQYCTKKKDCEDQGYYWYNNTCNAQPEPTCANDIQYCTTKRQCESQGYYWYNNVCNTDPEPEPTCADGIQYCTTQSDCITQGYYWFNNTCNASAPTCADGIQYCTTQSDCTGQGHYWYNNACNATAPTCADGIQYCTTQSDCMTQGHYWYNSACNAAPEPVPTCADGIQYCTTQSECTGQGHYWYNNTCNADPEPEPTCADDIQYCTKKVDCEGEGYHWYNSSCHTEPEPTCADDIQYCSKKPDCEAQGYYWYDNSCHTNQQVTTSSKSQKKQEENTSNTTATTEISETQTSEEESGTQTAETEETTESETAQTTETETTQAEAETQTESTTTSTQTTSSQTSSGGSPGRASGGGGGSSGGSSTSATSTSSTSSTGITSGSDSASESTESSQITTTSSGGSQTTGTSGLYQDSLYSQSSGLPQTNRDVTLTDENINKDTEETEYFLAALSKVKDYRKKKSSVQTDADEGVVTDNADVVEILEAQEEVDTWWEAVWRGFLLWLNWD